MMKEWESHCKFCSYLLCEIMPLVSIYLSVTFGFWALAKSKFNDACRLNQRLILLLLLSFSSDGTITITLDESGLLLGMARGYLNLSNAIKYWPWPKRVKSPAKVLRKDTLGKFLQLFGESSQRIQNFIQIIVFVLFCAKI